MVLGEFFYQFTGSAAQTHCGWRPQLVSKKIFGGKNFCELVFDRENCENFPLYGNRQESVLVDGIVRGDKFQA